MAERGRGPGAFTVACGAGRAVVQAWHDEQRVERDRYAGLLAAGVTDAATPLRQCRLGVWRWRGRRKWRFPFGGGLGLGVT